MSTKEKKEKQTRNGSMHHGTLDKISLVGNTAYRNLLTGPKKTAREIFADTEGLTASKVAKGDNTYSVLKYWVKIGKIRKNKDKLYEWVGSGRVTDKELMQIYDQVKAIKVKSAKKAEAKRLKAEAVAERWRLAQAGVDAKQLQIQFEKQKTPAEAPKVEKENKDIISEDIIKKIINDDTEIYPVEKSLTIIAKTLVEMNERAKINITVDEEVKK